MFVHCGSVFGMKLSCGLDKFQLTQSYLADCRHSRFVISRSTVTIPSLQGINKCNKTALKAPGKNVHIIRTSELWMAPKSCRKQSTSWWIYVIKDVIAGWTDCMLSVHSMLQFLTKYKNTINFTWSFPPLGHIFDGITDNSPIFPGAHNFRDNSRFSRFSLSLDIVDPQH